MDIEHGDAGRGEPGLQRKAELGDRLRAASLCAHRLGECSDEGPRPLQHLVTKLEASTNDRVPANRLFDGLLNRLGRHR